MKHEGFVRSGHSHTWEGHGVGSFTISYMGWRYGIMSVAIAYQFRYHIKQEYPATMTCRVQVVITSPLSSGLCGCSLEQGRYSGTHSIMMIIPKIQTFVFLLI